MAAPPVMGEKLVLVAMLFFLAYSTPSRWVLQQANIGEVDLAPPPDPLASLLLLGFAAFFVIRLFGNLPVALWVANQAPLFVAFFAFLVLSALWSANPGETIREAVVLALVALYALYAVTRFELKQIVLFTAVATTIGVMLSLSFALVLPEFGDSAKGWTGIHSNKNTLGRISALSAINYLFAARLYRRFRSLNYLLAALAVVLVIGSESSTAIVSLTLLVATMAVVLAFRSRRTLFGAVVLAFLSSLVIGMAFATANLGPITDILGKDITLTGRVGLWDYLLTEVTRRPFFGWGWNAYWGGWFSPAHEVWIEEIWLPPHSHNALFDYVLQLGIIGATLYLLFYCQAIGRSVRFVRDVPGAEGIWPVSIFAFVMLQSITETGALFRGLEFFFLVVAVLAVGVSCSPRRPDAPIDQQLTQLREGV